MTFRTCIIFGSSVTLCAAAFAFPAQASAAPAQTSATAQISQLAFGDAAPEGTRVMDDQELGEARGGYGGVYFTLFGYGDINNVAGGLPEGVSIGSQSADLVSLNLGLASLPNTGGFIQFASVVGNNNIVNNNLILNVYFLEGGVADTSNIGNGSMFGF